MLNFVPVATEREAERVRELFAHVLELCLISARTSIDARTVCLDYADFSPTNVANILRFVLNDEYDDATLERVPSVSTSAEASPTGLIKEGVKGLT